MIIVDTKNCKGCGFCVDACKYNAIIEDGYGYKIDQKACKQCGSCLDVDCAGDCISVIDKKRS